MLALATARGLQRLRQAIPASCSPWEFFSCFAIGLHCRVELDVFSWNLQTCFTWTFSSLRGGVKIQLHLMRVWTTSS